MTALVIAKAPVPGLVKTRLGVEVGMHAAAELAAAALRDTLEACAVAFGPARCHLALAGRLEDAVQGAEIRRAVAGWTLHPQYGDGLAARIAHAHLALGNRGPVVQVGMDTPQVRPEQLCAISADLSDADAVLGPADDGGWWVLGLRSPLDAAALVGVPMSTPGTYAATWAALAGAGLHVAAASRLCDVDTAADAEAVAAEALFTRFAAAWTEVTMGATA